MLLCIFYIRMNILMSPKEKIKKYDIKEKYAYDKIKRHGERELQGIHRRFIFWGRHFKQKLKSLFLKLCFSHRQWRYGKDRHR